MQTETALRRQVLAITAEIATEEAVYSHLAGVWKALDWTAQRHADTIPLKLDLDASFGKLTYHRLHRQALLGVLECDDTSGTFGEELDRAHAAANADYLAYFAKPGAQLAYAEWQAAYARRHALVARNADEDADGLSPAELRAWRDLDELLLVEE
jgi:hypothetical protein